MVFALIALAVASRLLPHPPNFAPVAAIGLFAGAMLGRRTGWAVPLVAMLASDAFLGFYHPVSMAFNYGAMLTSLLIGQWLLRERRGALRLTGATLLSAVAFFVVSNFGMIATGWYPATLAGVAQCYTFALPFFGNTLTSSVVFTAALFGGNALISRLAARPEANPARV